MGRAWLAVLLVTGCSAPSVAPSHITVTASSDFDAAEVEQAASLWSSVGADVRVADRGMPIVLMNDATWNASTWSDTAEGMAIDGRIIIHGSEYAQLLPGQRVELLAHEFGHALGLSHVIDDQYAVMYRTIHSLPAEGLRPADAAEYFSVHP